VLGRLLIDAGMKFGGINGWNAILRRNDWFQQWAAHEVTRSKAPTLFSYSYTARLPFAAAKERRATCILGQVDGGPAHFDFVRRCIAPYVKLADTRLLGPPQEYWREWREEVRLADKIIVNSEWSARLLEESGVSAANMALIPCVYTTPSQSNPNPDVGSSPCRERLEMLFLGSVSLAKGIGQLLGAIKMLKNEPVDFTFAGPIGVKIPDEISGMSNVRFLGPVDKATAERLYRQSDVFLFPTLSDGFGLTQLEALGHGLPVIASTHCGQVVQDRDNGLVLPEVSPETIAQAIMELMRDRDLLAKLKANARVPDKCHPRHLAPALLALEKN
jgi:glycosyltransferase involved in cell wall biosynthesis